MCNAVDPIREATPTIPDAWDMLKKTNERRMLPFVEYSHYARVRIQDAIPLLSMCVPLLYTYRTLFMQKCANPTSRRLLMYYDQPVRMDSKTGEVHVQ